MTISEPIESQRAIPDTIFHKFTVVQLAARWRRKEDDILSMLEAGDMSAYCWYEGYVHSLLQRPDVAAYYYKGWGSVSRDFSCLFLLGKEAEVSSFSPFIEPRYPDMPRLSQRTHDKTDVLFPMRKINDNPAEYSEAPFPIAKADIVFMGHDVERIEKQKPELYAASLAVEQNTTERKVPTLPIRKPGVKNKLTLALENARAILIGKTKKEPSVAEIIAFLKQEDPTGTVIGYKKNSEYSTA